MITDNICITFKYTVQKEMKSSLQKIDDTIFKINKIYLMIYVILKNYIHLQNKNLIVKELLNYKTIFIHFKRCKTTIGALKKYSRVHFTVPKNYIE